MPEVSMMLPLCEILDISVNELLSGEKLSKNDYHSKAEENIINLVQEKEKINKNGTKTSLLSLVLILIVVLLLMIILSVYTGPSVFQWEHFLEFPDLLAIVLVTVLLLLITGQLKYFGKSFVIACGKYRTITSEEKKKTCDALVFVEKLLWCISSVIVMVYLIVILYNTSEVATLVPNLAVALQSLFYAAFGNLILLPIKSLVESKCED